MQSAKALEPRYRAISVAAGLEPDLFVTDLFVKQFDALRKASGAEIAAGDSFVLATKKVLAVASKLAADGDCLPGYHSWFAAGTAAVRTGHGVVVGVRPKVLVEKLKLYPTPGADWLPRNEREAAGALLRATPILRDIGIDVYKRQPSVGNVYWEFTFSSEAVDE